MVIQHGLGIEEYLALPEEKPYLEYIRGEAVPKMAPDWLHFNLAKRILVALAAYESAHGGSSGVEGRVYFEDSRDPRYLLPTSRTTLPDARSGPGVPWPRPRL